MPPNQPPQGGNPQPGDRGYNPQGGPPGSGGQSQSGWSSGPPDPTQQYGQPSYEGQPNLYQPTEQLPQAQGGHGQPAPAWGQPAGYPDQGGYPEQGGYGGPVGPPPTSKSPLPWIIGGLVLLLVLGGVGLFFLLQDDDPTPVATTSSSSQAPTDDPSEESTEEATEESSEETTEDETTEESTDPLEPTPESGPLPPAGSPAPTGSGDPDIDGLAQACFDGDPRACDDLYEATAGPDVDNPDPTPELEPFFDYAFTCGARLTEDEVAQRFCVEIYPDA